MTQTSPESDLPSADHEPQRVILRTSLRRRPSLSAAFAALLFWWWSLTPSLLPRSWLAQGIVSALAAASGYMFGAAIGWLLRRLRAWAEWWTEERRLRAWQTLTGVGALAAVVGLVLWLAWQNSHRDLVNLEGIPVWHVIPMLVATVLLFAVLLLCGRLVGWLAMRIERFTGRFIPTWAAATVTALVILALWFAMTTRLGDAFVDWARERFGATDRSTEAGIVMPTLPTVSGSPDSLAPWDTLGFQGRTFVATAPTVAELREFTGAGAEVKDPIRVYAGLQSAATLEERAELIVAELERTGGFERKVLAIVTVTGTGWVDPDAAVAIEYMYGGDTAMVGMQYSYLPSWISFLVDGDVATEASAATNIAIRDALLEMPEEDRPRLVLFAQSLGSLGAEKAVVQDDVDASLDILTTLPDGVLLSGPTYGNPIWRQLVDAREASSPVWRPVYDAGRTVRVGNAPDDPPQVETSWTAPRVAYLHHPSDPVSYWNPSLLWSPPEWASDPIGSGVSPDTQWFPVVTFWQVVADLVVGFGTDPGFGHNYAAEFVQGWAAVAAPDGWTSADTDRLRDFLTPLQ
ncbi:MAG: alpha/beta-hydrolase family protein [Acidimicrobiia bacterium]|nr:alpha/beta-hydrolase family protein [Acidimicrobiia bacterium]